MPAEQTNEGQQEIEGTSGATETTTAPAAKFTQEDVNRIVAREQKKLGAKLEAELADLRKKAAEADELRSRVAEFDEKDKTEVEKLRKRIAEVEKAKADRENELARSLAESKAAADAEYARLRVEALVAGRVPKENGPDDAADLFGRHARRSQSDPRLVVWIDPETDEEVPLDKALEAFLAKRPYFLSTPPAGTGALGGPPGRGQKPFAAMSAAELEEVVNQRAAGKRQ